MKATRFEYRHQTLLHLLLVGLAVATYLRNPDDIVWAMVRGHSDSVLPERMVFGAGALMLLGSAVLETWANARSARLPKRLARIFLALGVGQLLPLPGLVSGRSDPDASIVSARSLRSPRSKGRGLVGTGFASRLVKVGTGDQYGPICMDIALPGNAVVPGTGG